jgi:glycerol kinase
MAILAIDQGTTGSTVLVMDEGGKTLGRASREFPQHFPQPGWVEHEPEEIWASVVAATEGALQDAGMSGSAIKAIGITNQRETSLVWERGTGRPIHRAIVWQDRRTAGMCEKLKSRGLEPSLREQTGLVFDAYFSGTKWAWILEHVPGAMQRAEAGDLALGTVDSYLIYRLSGGKSHVTDVTNASRTLLMGLRSLQWEPELLSWLGLPAVGLPLIVPSAGEIAKTKGFSPLPDGVPICGVAGDQQAALFGQACFEPGEAKCTYGTGAFVLVNTGEELVASQLGLLTTVAWQIGDKVNYALEGSSFIAGAAVQWLRDGLGIIRNAKDIEPLAMQVPSSDGVIFVPALSGLGAPYWDPNARGTISGLTRGTTAAHLARATLEGIAFSVNDLIQAMISDLGQPVRRLRVDGGAAANGLLMQFQSDLLNVVLDRPKELESTARGAAMLAGLGAGIFKEVGEAKRFITLDTSFSPAMAEEERKRRLSQWKVTIDRMRSHSVG